jgi:2-C-methyl-D-erythritol 4-phosphate cytidylyltransferase
MGQFAVILPAAGRSTRFGDPKQKKIYAELDGRAVWLRALDPFLTHGEVEQIIVAIAPEDRELFERRYRDKVAFLNLDVIEGGAERYNTVARALERVRPACEFVAVHDAARPCLSEEMVDAVFAAAREHGAALLATPVTDTVKRSEDGRFTVETVSRTDLFLAQTPQVFRRDWIEQAFARRNELGRGITDDTQLVEALGHRCAIVAGSPFNLKITTQDDLRLAGAILKIRASARTERCGHPFADESAMWADLPRLKPSDLFDGE